MMRSRLPSIVALAAAIAAAGTRPPAAAPARVIAGTVVSEGRPVPGATVRRQAAGPATSTDAHGAFSLAVDDGGGSIVFITAAKPGYFNARRPLPSNAEPLTIELQPIPAADDARYRWQDPRPDPRQPDNCGNCHDRIFNEWSHDPHADSAASPLVLTMYEGTNVRGRRDVGPGYRRDWNDEGNCAHCHAPLSTANSERLVRLSGVAGVPRLGVSCDFCHKVAEIPPAPHITGLHVRRPSPGGKLLFGPLDDATFPGEVPDFSVAPAYRSSEYCAPCHEAQYWGVSVYSTFSEWQRTSFAEDGVQCQSCHMRPAGNLTEIARLDKGGRPRAPDTIPSHAMMSADPDAFIRSAARLDADVRLEDDGRDLRVATVVSNVGAGHDLPTGQPMRHMLLVVSATDATGRALVLADGERLPSWAGDEAGAPGRGFAKILVEASEYAKPATVAPDGGVNVDFPAPFWRRNRVLSDTRIPAGASSRSEFVFRMPAPGREVTVRVRLIYRKAFQPLAKVKGWSLPDLLVASASLAAPLAHVSQGQGK